MKSVREMIIPLRTEILNRLNLPFSKEVVEEINRINKKHEQAR